MNQILEEHQIEREPTTGAYLLRGRWVAIYKGKISKVSFSTREAAKDYINQCEFMEHAY